MAKIGDTVRFLNTTGGGKITKIEGRIAYVEEDGFETPVLLNEVVVVLPAGHEPEKKGARMMFDQKAFDNGKKSVRDAAPQKSADSRKTDNVAEPELPVEETEYGEDITVALVFEPENAKALSTSRINAALVNDSNYFLYFSVLIQRQRGESPGNRFSPEKSPPTR